MRKDILVGHIKKHISSIKNGPTRVFQITAYNSVIRKITELKEDKITINAIDNMDITDHMNKKLKEFIKITKESSALELFQTQLTNINGVGPKLSAELIKMGLKDIKDLKKKKYFDMLPIAAQVDITYKPISPIPRHMIEYLEKSWAPVFDRLKIHADFVGSYRRNKPQSSDIDILLYDPKGVINIIGTELSKGVIIYKPYAYGPSKVSAIVRLVKFKVNVKVDFFITDEKEYPFALLYSTGSKENNIRMRKSAKSQGLLLNQKGLYKGTKSIPAKTEKDIYNILKLPYQQPHER